MSYCPLRNYQYDAPCDCLGQYCEFTDEAGDCLIKQALQCYVSEKRTSAAEAAAAQEHFERLAKLNARAIKLAPAEQPSVEFYSKEIVENDIGWEEILKRGGC